tara:strand:+ start:3276 stop:3512 length:237 start_codon:yes stop_codon:yes gene_type:complete
MQFRQDTKDGSCDIIFSKEEIEIIKKNGKLHLSALTLKHFGNTLMKIVIDFNNYFNEDIKNSTTYSNTVVEGQEKKDV